MTKDEIKAFLSGFTKSGAPVSGLSRIKSLLCAVGNPESKLHFIHIAGTNGKGSVAAMLYESLLDAKIRAGQFTSPYILDYTDRIQLAGRRAEYRELSPCFDEVRLAVERLGERNFSQFEITMAAAMLYYKAKRAEVVVLEAGLGGKLDCTNVISSPMLCIITSISHDHMGVLGSSIAEISAQKAGIIKRGVPVVLSACNPPEAVDIISRRAREMGSPLIIPDKDLLSFEESKLSGERFSYDGLSLETAMSGKHQIINAMTAAESLRIIGRILPINDENISRGIARARIAGRTELLREAPMVLLDGCHNDGSIAALVELLKSRGITPTVIFGMLKSKDARGALGPLVGIAKRFITVDGFCEGEYEKNELAGILLSLGASDVRYGESIESEYKKAMSSEYGDAVIAGSLYLASKIKALSTRS